MSRRRTTFGKIQRDRDKQAKARAKIERRQERSEQGDGTDEPATPAPVVDQAAVLEAVGRSAATGFPVELPPSAAGPRSSSGTRPDP